MYLRSVRSGVSTIPFITQPKVKYGTLLAILLAGAVCFAQEQSPPIELSNPSSNEPSAENQNANVTIPVGTHLALVLTQPIQSRYVRRGDDVYAQVTSPVTSQNEVVIPAGTFVQGTVDKLGNDNGRAQLHLTSLAITFPDGYVAPISGPVTIETSQGYAIKDPGSKRAAGAFALAGAGAGIGALIGHSVGTSSSNVTSNFPPGCVGPPPYCTQVSTPVYGTKGRDTAMGAGLGAAIGAVGAIVMLGSSHHYFVDAGAPVGMTLDQPVTLPRNEVELAVRKSLEHPVAVQPVEPRPLPPPALPDVGPPPGFPGSPTAPPAAPLIIPGPPGANGVPGPPIIIPQ